VTSGADCALATPTPASAARPPIVARERALLAPSKGQADERARRDHADHRAARGFPQGPLEVGQRRAQLKRPWPDGRTHLVLEPVAFLRRLVGIIPPPLRHLVRYAGIFGPASKARAKLRALVPATDDTAHAACPGTPHPRPAACPPVAVG